MKQDSEFQTAWRIQERNKLVKLDVEMCKQAVLPGCFSYCCFVGGRTSLNLSRNHWYYQISFFWVMFRISLVLLVVFIPPFETKENLQQQSLRRSEWKHWKGWLVTFSCPCLWQLVGLYYPKVCKLMIISTHRWHTPRCGFHCFTHQASSVNCQSVYYKSLLISMQHLNGQISLHCEFSCL